MIVMGIDPASKWGWAAYDVDKPMSAIESGAIATDGSMVEKLWMIRNGLAPLIRKYRPEFVAIETPYQFIPRANGPSKAAQRASKYNLLRGVEPASEEGGSDFRMSPADISMLGQIAGACTAIVMAHNIECCQVAAKSWQTIISKDIHDIYPTWVNKVKDPHASKKRANHMCDRLKIVSPSQDSRDAALIAVWAGTASQWAKDRKFKKFI